MKSHMVAGCRLAAGGVGDLLRLGTRLRSVMSMGGTAEDAKPAVEHRAPDRLNGAQRKRYMSRYTL